MSALKNEEVREDVKDFIDYLKDCGEDAFYIFDNPDEAIDAYLASLDEDD